MLVQAQQTAEAPQLSNFHAGRNAPARRATAQDRGFSGFLDLMGSRLHFARNTEIYGQDEPAEYIYRTLSGSVRTYKLTDDGRRQIGAFYLAGDIFGLDSRGSHRFSAEAMTDSVLLAVKRSTLTALAKSDAAIARELWQITARELDHVHDQVLLLGRSSAQERVVFFLAEMAERSENHTEFDLPMSRQDIADYLGLTIETVSRTFSSMERRALIELPSLRKVRLKNRAALRAMQS